LAEYDPLTEEEVEIPENIINIPLLPLRDIVIFPHMIVPLFVGRSKSTKALEEAMMNDRRIVVVAQKQPNVEDPPPEDLFDTGTLCEVLNMVKLPDGTIKVLIEGNMRAKILEYIIEDEYFVIRAETVEENPDKDLKTEAMMRDVLNKFDKYVRLTRTLPPEAYTTASSVQEPGRLADLIASQLVMKVDAKQRILDDFEPRRRLVTLAELLEEELEILDIQKKIQGQVKKQIEKSQKEYYLKEQLKAISKELGESDEKTEEANEIRDRMEKAALPKIAREKVEAELKRLLKMPYGTAEAVVVRNYIDWILDIPWSRKDTVEELDIDYVRKVLDEDHYGLDKVKQRILEYLAVQRLTDRGRGVILCLVGPPGVGKTSLGKSVARALGRKYVRASLGGVRDEAEIRGHRRTYIGSMPGRILQQMKKAGVTNPVFLLDEVDKMSTDFRGDPSAALLEVLDPEMNYEFSDHYLEIPYDLSDVLFITTANLVQPIPPPLLDRMEVIRLPGYTEEEKVNIGKYFLIPKQFENNGLEEGWLKISDSVTLEIIRRYTREAGVRNLEREIGNICRKHATNIVEEMKKEGGNIPRKTKDTGEKEPKKKKKSKKKAYRPKTVTVTRRSLTKYIGQPKYRYGMVGEENEIGVATGLAWTQVGGELLNIEVTLMPGKGQLSLTGQLGDVMKESAQAAVSFTRSKYKEIGIAENFFQKHDIHLHVPEGATPKDGPSAGVTLASALISALVKIPVDRNVAMTGEITLRGKVLPVGGIKEKILAAHRAGITTVVLPDENEKDYKEIPENVRRKLEARFVRQIDEVLDIALTKRLPGTAGKKKKAEPAAAKKKPGAKKPAAKKKSAAKKKPAAKKQKKAPKSRKSSEKKKTTAKSRGGKKRARSGK